LECEKGVRRSFPAMAARMGMDSKDFLSRFVKSESARELIKKIGWYACKGHAIEISEHEAIFGYHLVVSAIYYLILLFRNPA
jgi:hypothetical protein